MSLQIWLPFTKDLRNNGVSGITITNSGATVSDDGKLGKCYSFNGSSNYMKATNVVLPTTQWSMAAWICPATNSSGTHQYVVGLNTSSASDFLGVLCLYGNKLCARTAGTTYSSSITYTLNTWYHLTAVYDGKLKIYINGELDTTVDSPATPVSASTLYIAMRGSSGYYFNGKLNDVRIYDHALSVAEIKEISKGLICHYKLDDFYSSDNLIVNGFGELGDENWQDATKISTTEIPPNHSEIKASFYGGNAAIEYIPIIKNHTYTMSGYVKAMSGQSGSKYPSLLPYDVDKNFIAIHHCRDGFNYTYMTTLARPLHKGDTIIYATDLSQWTTDTTNHYFHVAIFGYKNSLGEVYPDMVYTQDSPKFGTKEDKSNIDKVNNTVTLKSAFTGEDRPAGTTICQATEGATYFYPWGGIPVSSVTDWTFKTSNFTPATNHRLKCAEYLRWTTLGGLYIAGNKLVDNNSVDTRVVDSSGYGNHGIKNGSLSISTSTARHSLSTVFNGTNSFIEADPVPVETMTISLWLKTSWVTPSEYQLAVHDIQSGLGIGWIGSKLITNTDTHGPCVDMTSTNYTANIWNHIVVVNRGNSTHDVYVNGVLAPTTKKDYWLGDLTKLNIGVRHKNGSYVGYFEGQLSDFRAYATALSADDVLALYNVGAKVAKTGALLGYEMKEG